MAEDTLDRVPEVVRKAMAERGFETLTDVQRAVLDPALEGRDLRLSSQTGSGKTLAFAMLLAPLLEPEVRAAHKGEKKTMGCRPAALVITPTRELAAQVKNELAWALGASGARLTSVTGGTSVRGEVRDLSMAPDIIVGTPGWLRDHLDRGVIDASSVRIVVLDEADQMLDLGFREDLEAILGKMPPERRTHLVSATFPRDVLRLAQRYQNDAAQVEGTRLGAANRDIAHVAYQVPPAKRLDAVINLLLMDPDEQALVFVRTRADAGELARKLSHEGFAAAALHGDMEQPERTRTLEAFRTGRLKTLVATDVAARGIDVDIGRVIHSDPPSDPDAYTHRSGRTGRAGRKGESAILVPAGMREKVTMLLRRAKVEVEWRAVPGAEEVLRRRDERLHAVLSAPHAPDESVPDGRQRKLAARLLSDVEPLTLVLRLLARADRADGPAPRAVDLPSPPPLRVVHAPDRTARERLERRDGPPARFDRNPRFESRAPGPNAPTGPSTYAERSDRNDRGGDFGGERGPSTERPRQGTQAGFVAFYINWGERGGADPRRVMALVCRRGDIRGADVGSIQIGPSDTVVEVRAEVAETFAVAAGKPDKRDPKIRVEVLKPAAAAAPTRVGPPIRVPPPARVGPPSRVAPPSRNAPGTRGGGMTGGPRTAEAAPAAGPGTGGFSAPARRPPSGSPRRGRPSR
jgi:ATP-dependent RNA helicase DeaD